MIAIIESAKNSLHGTLYLPGDKSISQRRALLSLFVDEEIILTNYGNGEDCQTALNCISALGKTVEQNGTQVKISGQRGCKPANLNCGNSGTTTRLLMGILAGHEGEWVLTGDESLSRRPMERIAILLREMGASIALTDGHLPAKINGRKLQGIFYESPIASAQLKSAILLAGLRAKGVTRYREQTKTRDHTERLLQIEASNNGWIELDPGEVKVNAKFLQGEIPCDPSSATFWIVASLLIPGSFITLPNILANADRIEIINLIKRSGGRVTLTEPRQIQNEMIAQVNSEYCKLTPLTVQRKHTAKLIDEIPALAILANSIHGVSCFDNLDELRIKESDRLALILNNLQNMKAQINQETQNDLNITGPTILQGGEIETQKDHRIAMAFAVAGLAAVGKTVIQDSECVAVSYPDFWNHLRQLAPNSVSFIH